jgi:hypothetical protein
LRQSSARGWGSTITSPPPTRSSSFRSVHRPAPHSEVPAPQLPPPLPHLLSFLVPSFFSFLFFIHSFGVGMRSNIMPIIFPPVCD